MNIRSILAVALLCASQAALAKKAPLPMPLAPQLQVEVILNQQEMGVDVPATAGAIGAQFGILGALIGAMITSSEVATAEKHVADIRNLLIDYHFNESFERTIRAKLASDGISPNPQITFMASPWDAETAKRAGKVSADGILIIVPRFSIYNNFELMTVQMSVSSVNRTVKPDGKIKQKVVFFRNYVMQFPLDKIAGNNSLEDSQRWIALGKQGMAALLDAGVDQVVDMIVYDFSAQGRQESSVKAAHENADFHGKTYSGRKVRADPNWIWVRARGNVGLYGITGYYPLSGIASLPVAAPAAAPVAVPATTPPPGSQQ